MRTAKVRRDTIWECRMSGRAERLPVIVFVSSLSIILIGGSFLYGVVASRSGWFPLPQIEYAYGLVKEVVAPSDAILKTEKIRHKTPIATLRPEALQPGLVLVSGDIDDRQTWVRVMDRSGRVIQEWRPVWSEIWPADQGDFPDRPAEGMYLHGVDLLPDGSLVANFEHQSTVRLDACGNLLWKLDNLGHHSVHYAGDGTIWVSAEDKSGAFRPANNPDALPMRNWIMQQLSIDGKIMRTVNIADVLHKNDLDAFLYIDKIKNQPATLVRDALHLNDIETFPAGVKSDLFAEGDLLVSLRNISTVLVMDPKDLKVKFISTGRFVRQHDPDFMSDDKISVFDNHNVPNFETGVRASRIVEIDARTGAMTTVVNGAGEEPFFTDIMGVHQRLANGNILVVPSGEGRALEFSPDGHLVWRFDNRASKGINRRVFNAMVLPEAMDEAFFKARRAACSR
jgi:Arylsulfotransferase (ASST)